MNGVFYIGATSNTAIYTPPTPGNPQGTWAAGPVVPGGFGANDGAAAVETNGRVLFAAADTPLFAGLLVGVILIVGALTFFPALALGPILDHLQLAAGHRAH